MISQRDIAMFFHVIDVLGNPEKAKAELQTLINMRETLDRDKASYDDYVKMIDARVIEANTVLKNQKDRDIDLTVREEALAKAQQDVAIVNGKLRNAVAEQEALAAKLDKREDGITTKEAELDKREMVLYAKETDYNGRMNMLRTKEADYQRRMEKLRSISA